MSFFDIILRCLLYIAGIMGMAVIVIILVAIIIGLIYELFGMKR